MGLHPVVEAPCGVLERLLEPGIRERLDLPAGVADEMVMVLAVDVCRLEAGDSVPELDALDELQFDELVERPVDAGNPDRPAVGANPIEDLLRRATARLVAEMLDHGPPGAAVPQAPGLEAVERGNAPAGVVVRMVVGVHGANDIDS